MAEWLKAHAWKACIGETLSRVRIPLSPPVVYSVDGIRNSFPSRYNRGSRSPPLQTEETFLFIMIRIHSLILSLLFTSTAAFSQTAMLTGQVADETAADVPGAKVPVTGLGTSIKSATADNNGMYSVPAL